MSTRAVETKDLPKAIAEKVKGNPRFAARMAKRTAAKKTGRNLPPGDF